MTVAARAYDAADGPMAISVHDGLSPSPYKESQIALEHALKLLHAANAIIAKVNSGEAWSWEQEWLSFMRNR